MHDFLFELGCEELPSGAVWPLADEFAKHVLSALDKEQLQYGEVTRFASPRRIALMICDLQADKESQKITRRGPASVAAFDKEGNPTPALSGFAKSCGVEVSQLSKLSTDKGEWMVYETQVEGKKTTTLLPAIINQALASLSIAKPMRWGNFDYEFARPVHWAVLLYGDEVIAHDFLGVRSSNCSKGHRFHHPKEVIILSPKQYESQMQEAFVIADFAKRRHMIKEQVEQLATHHEAYAIMPEELINEVTSIVEWPQALIAHFEKEFLEVPSEALIASMQSHQKCFALKDKQGNLLPHFITVANIASTNPNQVVLGNEKVMRARLSDAAFFFRQDKLQALSNLLPRTQQVVFQVKLGTLKDKISRMQPLMSHLSQALNITEQSAQRAVLLSKCDLMTGMVGEFPELQGLMGYYYALHDGEEKSVAIALNEQYMPRFSADSLPKSDLGLALSLADRLDTLVGIFAIGQKPSGVKDPFKLRRHALAVVRLLIATPVALNLTTLINEALANYGDSLGDMSLVNELKPFIMDRLQSFYQSQGVAADLVQAVRARQSEWLYDLDSRLTALTAFVKEPEAATLSAACKRVNNLLNQSSLTHAKDIDEALLEEGAERALYDAINAVIQAAQPLYTNSDYKALLSLLASLKEPVDAFFEKVMVMVEDEALKRNRLALLSQLQDLLQGVADISLLQLQ